MKFFNKLFKAIGFDENESVEADEAEVIVKEKTIREKKENIVLPSAKFNLKENRGEIKQYFPKTQEEIEQLVENFRDGENLSINLEKFDEEDKVRALDFLYGAVFALFGEISKTGESDYLMVHGEDK